MSGVIIGSEERKEKLSEAVLEQRGANMELIATSRRLHVATSPRRDVLHVATSPRRDVTTSRRRHVATSPRRDVTTSRRHHVATSARESASHHLMYERIGN